MAYLRLGLVDAGRMGRTHLRALAESESVRVTAIAEPSVQQRQNLSGTAATVHATADAMLEAGNIDGVLIAAPTNLYLGLVEHVLARGLPVLCEKPCGATLEEAREAAQLAAEARLPLQVAYCGALSRLCGACAIGLPPESSGRFTWSRASSATGPRVSRNQRRHLCRYGRT